MAFTALFRRFFILVLIPLAAGCTGSGRTDSRYISHLDSPVPPRISEDEAVSFIGGNFSVLPGFYSHLPLVILDTKGEMVLPSHRWDSEQGFAVSIPGAKPYVRAEMAVIDGGEGRNRPEDTPVFTSPVRIRFSGDLSYPNPKGQYRINLVDRLDHDREAPLLGMESGNEWELMASVKDKSLMRDYLAFTITSRLMPYTPDVRYCEVLIRDGEYYFYQGVYLLAETITQGPGRVEIAGEAGEGENGSGGFILRRSAYDPETVTLDTYATRTGFSAGFLNLIYPGENVTGNLLAGIEETISRVERILYSDSPVVYVNYPQHIDVDSFINYHLINEYFMNFDAGFLSTYMYKDARGKLKAGPVWDNSGSFNNAGKDLNPRLTGFYISPWFDCLSRDLFFLKKLESQYSKLQRTLLADSAVTGMIDDIARWLEPARQRDWKRWGAFYTGTYGQELIKMKYLLTEHGAVVGNSFRVMSWEKTLFDSSYSNSRSSLLAVGFVVLFFLSVRFGRYH